jgi:DNA-binding NtrC family response regulator
VLREQPSCRAISRTPSPLRAITRISTACSWVNIDGQKAVSFAQVGQIYFGAVGQFCIGGDTQEQVNIRLLMTLKADPAELLEKRKLLEDLYAKLLEFEKIQIPPLRERPEDVPLLVRHFSHEICRELGLGDLVIDINAIEVLVRQTWRENIRELKAVVDKSVLFSNEGRFVLPPELVDEKTEVVKMINNNIAGQEFVLDKSLDVIEKGIIERSLERFGFNQSKAAQFLGMTEQTFRYKLKRLGIASARARA